MPVYDRSDATDYEEIDSWKNGFGWIPHPEETGRRASHAVTGDRGVWIIDPLEAPGVKDEISELGEVAGVAVLSNWHTRDAGIFAESFDVSVHIPEWMDRVEERVDAPVENYSEGFDPRFSVRRCEPIPLWREAIAYNETDGTVIVPESLGTASGYTVKDERIGVPTILRLFPPRKQLEDVEPECILVGHGEGIFEDAPDALEKALGESRRRFPRAFVSNTGTQIRGLFEALRG